MLHEAGEESRQKRPQVGEDLSDVVAAAAEHGEERVTKGALEGATSQAAIGLYVADLGFDGTAAAEQSCQPRRQATACSADEHPGALHSMAPVAAIDHGQAGDRPVRVSTCWSVSGRVCPS